MSFEDLASEIKDRLRGSNGDRPRRDEWTLADKVYSLAERSIEGEERSRLASAVLLLLGEMMLCPVSREAVLEWPAGLFWVATRVSWTAGEQETLVQRVQALIPFSRWWPTGEAFDGLGSPRLEFLRLVRFVQLARVTDFDTQVFWEMLASPFLGPHESGAVMGLIASCGFEADAMEYLPGNEAQRDQVFRAFMLEYERFGGDSKKIAQLLPRAIPESPAWVATAIDWIGVR